MGGVASGLVARALPLGVGAALLSRPRRASPSPGAIFDPTKDPETIGFTRDGDRTTNSVVPDAIQLVKDVSAELHLAFFAPAATASGNIEVRARFGVDMAQNPLLDFRGDTGVRFGFSDESNLYLASAIMRDNVKRVAIVTARGFSNGLVVPWDAISAVTLRRVVTPAGRSAELIFEGATDAIAAADLPPPRPTPTLEYGCYSNGAKAVGMFESLVDSREVAGPIPVAIKIKPGSDTASINLRSAGIIPVAILSSPTFDATQVDPATVSLAGAKVKLIGKGNRYSCAVQDVNGDGLPDLLCHVVTADFMLEPGESIAVLEAETYNGRDIRGQDTVRIVP